MDSFIEKYLKRVEGLKAEGTYKKRLSDLRDFDGWVQDQGFEDVSALGVLDLEEYFIGQKGRGYAPETIGARFQSVRGLYDFLAGKLDVIEETPFNDLKRSEYVDGTESKKHDESAIVYLTPDEKEVLVENVPNPTLRNEFMIRLMWQTGVRRGEVTRIELDDVDRESRSVTVWSTKTHESRTVYYQPSLDLLMDQWLDGGYRSSYPAAERSDALFITRRGQLRDNRVNRIINKAAENAGIQEVMYEDENGLSRYRITSHALRHGHAVHALKSGIDVRTVQKHLGHSDIERTMQYLQLLDEDVRDGYRRFGMETTA